MMHVKILQAKLELLISEALGQRVLLSTVYGNSGLGFVNDCVFFVILLTVLKKQNKNALGSDYMLLSPIDPLI